MNSPHRCARAIVLCGLVFGAPFAVLAPAAAQPDPAGTDAAPTPAGEVAAPPAVQMSAPTADNANPVAVTACGRFAEVLDATSTYYGDFADALEQTAQPNYGDPSISGSNTVGRTALRQGAVVAMDAANLPGLPGDIAGSMRNWSLDATKLLVKMGLHGSGESLNATASEMNNDAVAAQTACAAAGTHA